MFYLVEEMIATRQCVRVVHGEYQSHAEPEDTRDDADNDLDVFDDDEHEFEDVKDGILDENEGKADHQVSLTCYCFGHSPELP